MARNNGPGRPPKLECDPEITQRVVNSLLAGSKRQTAAHIAGISLRTLELWLHNGREEPDSMYGEFLRAVHGAEAQCQQSLSASVMIASRADGRLALDMLSRRWPNLWPKETQRFQVKGQVEHTHQHGPALWRAALELAEQLRAAEAQADGLMPRLLEQSNATTEEEPHEPSQSEPEQPSSEPIEPDD